MPNVWKYTVRGFREALSDEETCLQEKADRISEVISTSTWSRALSSYNEFDTTIEDLLEELRDSGAEEDTDWFNTVLAALYDEADYHRVWLG